MQPVLTLDVAALPLEPVTIPVTRIAHVQADLVMELELSDDDLDQVAGGLARVWSEGHAP